MREFVEPAFSKAGRTIEWRGESADEIGVDAGDGSVLVRIDPRYFRPTEVDMLLGDPSEARRLLGWKHTITFLELVSEMVSSDLEAIEFHWDARPHTRVGRACYNTLALPS